MRRALIAAVLAASAGPAAAVTYEIDQAHSNVMFRIRHLVSKVSGRFGSFSGTFDYEPDAPKGWKAQAVIQTASIDTDLEARDKHLRSGDFFDAERCPTISFKSTKVSGVKKGKGKLHGELTMRCVTKPVVLDLEVEGPAEDPWGNAKVGAVATGSVNRKDYGINWNKALDKGGYILGEEVEITVQIEGQLPKK